MKLSRAIVLGLIPVFIGCAALIDLEPGELDPSASGSSSGSGGGGAGIKCASNADCPPNSECATWGCSDDVCAVNIAVNGTPVQIGAIAGDCKKNVCQDGEPAVVPDDTDLLQDNDPCTVEMCSGGVLQKGPAPNGTACGSTGKLSCLDGLCAGCSGDSTNCDPPTQCQEVTCPVNTCIYETLVGKVVNDPAQDDCKHDVCDANGNVATVGDTTETPPQMGDDCKVEQCASDGSVTQVSGNEGSKCANPMGVCYNDSVCSGGACAPQQKPAGTKIMDDIDGDCLGNFCDPMGNPKQQVDDSDAPVDQPGDCQVPACSGGMLMTSPEPNGTDCTSPSGGKCCGGGCCANTGAGYCDANNMCCGSGKICNGSCCPSPTDNCVNNVCCSGNVCNGACCQTEHNCTGAGTCCPAFRQCPDGVTCCPVGQTCDGGNFCSAA